MSLADRVVEVAAMSLAERKAKWHSLYGTPVPPAFSGSLLTRALAYRNQEKQLGGLKAAELKRLATLSRKEQRARSTGVVTSAPKPGTWLSRTWHGEVHQVIVLEKGYDYRGERYPSLSIIAHKITGAKWSGPRFFGLHSPRLGKLGVTAGG